MTPPPNSPNIAKVYAVFEALCACARLHFDRPAADQSSLGGKLILYAGLDDRGAATALASSIAGGASLGLDSDPDRLKDAMRHGVCDFVVNHLDEALRVLKNEIRKRQPVSVGLVCDVPSCLESMIERGVQPDVLSFQSGEHDASSAFFIARCARLLAAADRESSASQPRGEVWWSVADLPARWLPKLDALAEQVIAEASSVPQGAVEPFDDRLRWLRMAPRYLVRPPEHYLKFTSAEEERFLKLVKAQIRSGALPLEILFRRGSESTPEALRIS